MSANVLLNLLNELGEKRYMRGLSSILSLNRNEFHKFNNTGARMLDPIYHMTLKIFKIRIFGVKSQDIPLFYATLCNVTKSVNH